MPSMVLSSCRWRAWAPIVLALAGASSVPASVHAQQPKLHRCGNTFSQTPCEYGAAPITVKPSTSAPTAERSKAGLQLCSNDIATRVGATDARPAQVRAAGERKAEVITFAGTPTVAYRYDFGVSIRQPGALLEGMSSWTCWVSEDQARVLRMSASDDAGAARNDARTAVPEPAGPVAAVGMRSSMPSAAALPRR
jgi:hypothetical protein